MTLGGIEAGGTKWVCAIGDGPGRLGKTISIPTTTPGETLGRAVGFFSGNDAIEALGVGSFGPIDIHHSSPTWGHITTTPKPGWPDTDVASMLGSSLGVPVAFDTDVNAAALGEHRWGAAVGLETFSYITVGTGIGGGGMANGGLMHGLVHPEIGHMRIPHDRARDPFPGVCPYHADCFEGLASAGALERRWGTPPESLTDETAWELEAEYIALGVVNIVCVLSPQRIILGGGVMRQPTLLPRIRRYVRDLLSGYVAASELGDSIDDFVVSPALGERAGVLGAIELARALST
jgi:fructokinase